ncbi:RCF2 [Candida margitis]|uniref:RCF2 n=1 Tax=Candida margitis TaxID=1775924 RepID=UPI0022261993|nr:RCF2 [Candida margitis]KAI5954127.1 RCF2 [Candida margitis]
MKILSTDEKNAHMNYLLSQGAKGLVYGGVVSAGIYSFFKYRRPARFATFTASVKAAIIVVPTIGISAFWADQGSWEFDKMMHQSEYTQQQMLEEHRKFNSLSTSEKIFTTLGAHKYQIIIAAWAASLYGSWTIINRDKVMTTAQKAVQARVYAQAITVVLLLGTILLSLKEAEINKSKPAPLPHWKQVLLEKEAEKQEDEHRLAEEKRNAAEKKETL